VYVCIIFLKTVSEVKLVCKKIQMKNWGYKTTQKKQTENVMRLWKKC